jgi:hypothetical protein
VAAAARAAAKIAEDPTKSNRRIAEELGVGNDPTCTGIPRVRLVKDFAAAI